ncbi:MAG: hypothetical protein A3F82_04415 [Deltaproteobacteria bacterium RIFCSPLOWO2_12_FULL_44_12]|nr:MAG: hypothetical protein A2712_08045 [Deltaproteobacteria bacterium RIFCSPHIGHO2_01_FULL_43_49]OGQ14711.1 MAG: hypothetical protein A3D22_08955 [Deltaproteobacteria bacterium RIFCSPHIGHO2_02_FULL_44_53]OGQ28097.1 MAG: hypothetical protein A3D98_07665 [Deltaproteobacteria bacterium RIFCSPHIGHO2_12_FULL_44_21]OGQ31309.1 MAG: hypothetical protein A2979_07715 [Deltaproteobacteria bacterium RIFCSPLOWO2_01_FULL_45_74]OGQ43301.1 MAG: hypothetical protein A3I70_01375 [Deltaproteobacteria bacterium 
MRRVFGVVFLFFTFFSFQTVEAGLFHPFKGWRTIDIQHFSIHYHQSIEEVAQRAAGYLEEAHEKLSPQYQWKPWGRTQIVLTDNFDDSNGLASVLPYNWILLRVVPPEPESSLAMYDDWLKTLITHEYTHILHLDAYGGFWKPVHWILGKLVAPAGLTPNWVKEGTATLEETEETEGGRGRAAYSEMLLRTAILNKQFPTIDRAAGVHWKWPGFQTPYIFGVKFMQYLKERFGEEKFQAFHKKTQRNFFIGAINSHARTLFGKSFYELWKDWKKELEEKYEGWESNVRQKGLTEVERFLSGKESFYLPTFSRDGEKLAYVTLSPRKASTLWLKDLKGGKPEKLGERTPSQISFSPDGGSLVFSSMATHKRFYRYYDLFQVDLKTKKSKRLTHGKRARDPDFSPDGSKILFAAGEGGTDSLKVFDVETREITSLVEASPFTQFANPRFSPDGSQFAVVRFQNRVGWELCLYRADGSFIKQLTKNGLSVESRPTWSPDGRFVLFSSDEDGVNNFYAYDLTTEKKQRLTQVLTGVFQPALSPDGNTLLARYYNGDGYDIRKVPLDGLMTVDSGPRTKDKKIKNEKSEEGLKANATDVQPTSLARSQQSEPQVTDYEPHKYNPFRGSLFLPRYVLPGFIVLDNGLLVSGATGGNDPLHYHNWIGGATYRTDAKHLGYFGRYTFSRYQPTFGIGIDDSAVDFGTLSFSTGNTYHFYEERRQAYAFFSVPLGTRQAVGASYFYEDRMPITGILANEAAALNLGIFSGININYVYGDRTAYPASISPTEKGRTLRLNGTITDGRLGANEQNEQKIFSGDYREYIPLGKNHVIAMRAAGGIAFGDAILPGTFSLGGSLGEGALTGGTSSRSFSLRGLPLSTLVRDKVMLLSTEYRLPLVSPQRGLGTWPIFLNNLHLGFFADYGDAWGRATDPTKNGLRDFFDDFFLGVGAELRGDFVIGHGLPLTGRVGYARIMVNRDRLGNLRDPFLNNLVRNGMFILQWGSSF